jgi:hypothetical protein
MLFLRDDATDSHPFEQARDNPSAGRMAGGYSRQERRRVYLKGTLVIEDSPETGA